MRVFKSIEMLKYDDRATSSTMKKTTITGIIAITAALVLMCALITLTGCQQYGYGANVSASPEPEVELNPITGEPYQDLPEKRGVITNITEFDELLRRASSIASYKYTLTDTDLGIEDQQFWFAGRFVKTRFPYTYQHSTGQIYDEVFLERTTKQAFTHCSREVCEKPNIDKELERVDYEEFYVWDPMEYLFRATKPSYVTTEMVGNDYTKVFSVTFEGKEARLWLQEYYGYPLKIVVRNEDDSKRTIEFKDMMVDATRRGEIDLPTNFTISGEEGNWYFWEHYLGEWPKEGSNIEIPPGEVKPAFGV